MADFSDIKESPPESLDLLRLSGDIWQTLEKFDERIKQYHLSLKDPSLNYFKEAIRLLHEITLGIAEPKPEWPPKFKDGSKVAEVLALSAIGSLRSLLASYKLLIAGYFMEAHNSMRIAEQWSELSVIVEANPGLASQILEEGVQEQFLKKARKKSSDFDNLLKAMNRTFHKLAERGHITKNAIQLSTKSTSDETMGLAAAGIGSAEMLKKDGLALAVMAMNVISVLSRHFKTVPSQWNSRFALTNKLIEEHKSITKPKP